MMNIHVVYSEHIKLKILLKINHLYIKKLRDHI